MTTLVIEFGKTVDDLGGLERAEEFLDFFGLAYDPHVLEANRLPILKAFGREVAEIEARRPAPGEHEKLDLYARALERAYARFASPSREAARPPHALGNGGGRCGGCGERGGC